MPDQPGPLVPVADSSTTTTAKDLDVLKQHHENQKEVKMAVEKYGRGKKVALHNVKDKKLKTSMKKLEHRYKEAAIRGQEAELLNVETAGFVEAEGMERTFKFKQRDIVKEVDVQTAKKAFDLNLPTFGPYTIDYTRNGRYLMLGGRKGHLAAFDWREGKLESEIQLGETIRCVKWLHNEQYRAVSQKKYVYIYDLAGVELHKLKDHVEVTHMEFLPYHFLLATVGMAGWLKYQDTSTGQIVSEHRTKLGTPSAMALNNWNGIVNIGHANGTVTMWSPNTSTPLVKMLTHRGPVRAIAIDRDGRHMATAGADNQLKIWDVRTYKELHSYYTPTPASSMHISDTGLLSVSWGPHVTIWKDALRTRQETPYLNHLLPSHQTEQVRFCPLDDVLGVGYSSGFASLIVPGAGEPNYDALELNPFETPKQRKETEVRMLMNKLQPSMIALNPDFIGQLDPKAAKELAEIRKREEAEKAGGMKEDPKFKMRGRNSAMKKYSRKKSRGNVIDEKRVRYEEIRKERARERAGELSQAEKLGPGLERFAKPKARV